MRALPLFLPCFLVLSCNPNESAQKAALEERVKRLETTAPGVGEVMSGVQLHFAKLYFAARAENWKLADFEIDEVKENLETAATLRPQENGVELGGVVSAFEQTQLTALHNAIAKHETKPFMQSYREAIAVCNSCHRVTGRPFIIITEPAAPPVPNQEWAPPQE